DAVVRTGVDRGRVDVTWGIGIRDVGGARRGVVADEGDGLAVGREVERTLRLRGEARHHLVRVGADAVLGAVRYLDRADVTAARRQLHQVDGRGDTEARVDSGVVEHLGVVPTVHDGGGAGVGRARGRAAAGGQLRRPG